MKRVFTYLLSLLALTSCFESVEYSTKILMTPMMMDESGDYIPLDWTEAYAFVADTAIYEFGTYDEAYKGVMKNKESGASLSPIAAAYTYSIADDLYATETLAMDIDDAQDIIILVLDTQHEAYCYRLYTVAENLIYTYLYPTFYPYKYGSYTYGDWCYVSPEDSSDDGSITEFTVVITPMLQQVDGGTFEPMSGTLAYAYEGQIDDFSFDVSYDLISSGVIKSSTGTTKYPDYSATTSGNNLSLSNMDYNETIVILTVDTVNKVYCYGEYTIDDNYATSYLSLPFYSWMSSEYTYGDWNYVTVSADE
ncbi:MAG: hypothetical protein SNG47_07105 [Rikenellaceae bacterium]